MNRRLRDIFRSWSTQDEESRNAFLLIAGISAVVIFALGIIGYGYWQDRGDGSGAVVRVGDDNISYDYLQKRLAPFMRGQGDLSAEQFSSILSAVLTDLEKEVLLLHIAQTKGVEVSEEEVDAQMRAELGLSDDVPKQVFASTLRRELLGTDLSLDQYRRIQRARVIENKLREEARQAVPSEAEQVNIRLIQAANQADIAAAKARLDAGELMGLVAATHSTHASKNRGGEIGWVVRGTFNTKLEDAMFVQPVGSISDVIETDEGFYIVQVAERELRPVEDSTRNAAVSRSYNQALGAARDELGAQIVMTISQLNRLTEYFRSSLNAGG